MDITDMAGGKYAGSSPGKVHDYRVSLTSGHFVGSQQGFYSLNLLKRVWFPSLG